MAAAVALIVATAPVLAHAQQAAPEGTTSEKLAELKRRLAQSQTQESDLLSQIRDSDARVAELNRITSDLGVRLADARRRLGGAQADLDQATASYLAKLSEVEEADRLFSQVRTRLEGRVIRMYKDGNLGGVDLLLNAKSLTELDSGRSYLNKVEGDDRASADRLQELRDQLDGERALLESTKTELLATRNRVDNETSELTNLYNQNQSALDAVQAEQNNHRDLYTKILADKNETQKMIDQLEGASNQAGKDLTGEGSRGNPGVVPGYFIWPAEGPITSPFGVRIHPITGKGTMHNGVDIGAGYGAPIHAAASGRVLRAGPYGGYGLATIIDHGNGLATLYGHQSRQVVSPGDQVTQGQVIGYVGSTGFSTGPHLHFEVRVNGDPRDPLLWFPDKR